MNKFQVEAVLQGVTPRADGGVSLRFVTNEVSKADKVMLMEFFNSFGWVLFSANEFQESDVPTEQAKHDVGTSPSKRLKNVLFVLWKQQGENGDFDAFYKQQIEKVINAVKTKLTD